MLPKSHRKYESAKADFHELHTCQTEGMWNVLVDAMKYEWGDKDKDLNSLWVSRLVQPYNNWYLGFISDCPCSTPANQPQEGWHNNGVMQVLKNELRAATATVLEESLPKVMRVDGLQSNIEHIS